MLSVLTLILLFRLYCECTDLTREENVLLDTVENDIREAIRNIEQQNVEIEEAKSRLRKNEAKIETLKGALKSKRQVSIGVGFTASLTHTLRNLGDHQIIKFDKVVTNAGNGYSATTGIFTCPVSGLYEFSSSIVSNGDHKNVDVDMVREGNRILYIHATLFGFDTGSQVIITHCTKGQKVWIRHTQGHTDSKELLGGHCSFSGHLIHAD